MKYHTDNLGERAASIADREAENRCRELWDYGQYPQIWLEIYNQTLREFAFQC